jgi:putative transposase
MLHALHSCTRLWNIALAHRQHRWRYERQATSYRAQQAVLTHERHLNPEIASLHSQVAQDVLRRFDKAFNEFFRQQSRYSKFKRFSDFGSFAYPQGYNGSAKADAPRRLFLSKIGNIPTVFHRPLPNSSRLKACTVIREVDGKWFASLVFEEIVPLQNLNTAPRPTGSLGSPIGVDLGLLSLITTSDGEVEHPRFLRLRENRLMRHQRHYPKRRRAPGTGTKRAKGSPLSTPRSDDSVLTSIINSRPIS